MSNGVEGEGARGDTGAGSGCTSGSCGIGGGAMGDDGTGAGGSISVGTGAADVRPRLA
jgi:hypothetical protein